MLRASGVKPLTPLPPLHPFKQLVNLRICEDRGKILLLLNRRRRRGHPYPYPNPHVGWGPTFRNRRSFYRLVVEMFDEMRLTFVERVVMGQRLCGDENVGKRLVEAIGRINCEQETGSSGNTGRRCVFSPVDPRFSNVAMF